MSDIKSFANLFPRYKYLSFICKKYSIVNLLICLIPIYACNNSSLNYNQDKQVDHWEISKDGDSIFMRYADEGRLTSFTKYKNNIKNGPAKSFYSNGNTEFEIIYVDGLKQGLVKWYYESGELYRETYYKEGKEQGIQKKYYKEGGLMAEIPYENGRTVKGLKEYTKEGELKKNYPDLIIEPIDKTAFENKFILKCYLSDHSNYVDYYKIIGNKQTNDIAYIVIPKKDGIGEIVYYLQKGGYLFENVKVRAEVKTALQNIYVIEKNYNLALDN